MDSSQALSEFAKGFYGLLEDVKEEVAKTEENTWQKCHFDYHIAKMHKAEQRSSQGGGAASRYEKLAGEHKGAADRIEIFINETFQYLDFLNRQNASFDCGLNKHHEGCRTYRT